jgi:DNA primase
MGRIPEGTIQDIRHRVDIVGLIGRYVELKRAGRNFVGRCPFHNEKTPSFNVSPERHAFHCFGCQEGGDAIAFLMKHDGLAFPEAVRTLATECGIEIPETAGEKPGERGLSERLLEANDIAQQLYREALESDEGAAARDYLAGRKLAGSDIERHGIGFAPDRWDAVVSALRGANISLEVGEQAGLVAPRTGGANGYYDRLRGRITFPIHNVGGRVVGFGGRAMMDGQEPKYLNTPETAVFRKRETFYGFPDALAPLRAAGRAIICEGYFDRIALARADMGEGLATCGTALTREHAIGLRRRTDEVVMLFDGDNAGRKAMERSLEVLLPQGLRVRAAVLPKGEDPDSFLVAHGAEALRDLIAAAGDAIDEVTQRAVDAGCATPAQKADVVNRIVPLVALIPDGVERGEYARRIANWTATDEREVSSAVRVAARGKSAPVVEATRVAPRRESSEGRHLHDLAVLLLRAPTLAGRFSQDALLSVLPDGSYRAAITALLGAADAGLLDPSGAADVFALEEQLDEDATVRLREVALDSERFQGEVEPEEAIDAIVGRFEKRRIDALQKELTRKMSDPDADRDELLRQKTKLKSEGLGILRANDAGARSGERNEAETALSSSGDAPATASIVA